MSSQAPGDRRKAAHLTSVHPPADTRIFAKECRSLVAAGYHVVLVVPSHEPLPAEMDGVHICRVPPATSRVHRMTNTTWQVIRAALREDADIYHLHDPELLPWAKWLQARGKRVVYDMHENVYGAIQTKPWIHARLRAPLAHGFRLLERTLLLGVPVIFAESSYNDDYRWVKTKTTVLNYPLVDELLALEGTRQAQPTVAYMGAVSENRGSLNTLAALHQLAQQGIDVGFECVGRATPAHQQQLTELADAYGLTAVSWRGYLRPQIGWEIVRQCHIGLAVLRNEQNYVDSYPTKLFEYMALGLPVIASDFPLYRSVVESAACGLCIAPDQPAALAEAIAHLVQHPAEAAAMGERGRQAVRAHYNWRHEAAKLVAFYDTIIGP